MLFILVNSLNVAVADTHAVGWIVPEHQHLVTIVPVQTIPGTKPDESPAILVYRFNRAV